MSRFDLIVVGAKIPVFIANPCNGAVQPVKWGPP